MKLVWVACSLLLAACQKPGSTRERAATAEPPKIGKGAERHCFSVTAEGSSPSTLSLFEAKRCQGGGVTWAAILNALVHRRGKTRAVEQPTPGWSGEVQLLSWKRGTARFAIDDEGEAALFCTDAPDLLNDIRNEAARANESAAELARAMAEADPEALECSPDGISPVD